MKFKGPLEVWKIISPVIVDLRDRRRRWIRHIHIQDLKPDTKHTRENNVNNKQHKRTTINIENEENGSEDEDRQDE